jgi:hypothetical protein
MAFHSFLKPKKTYYLKRIGKDNDGGYLVGSNSIKDAKNIISLGISDDWSSEKNFLKHNNNIKIFCYDDQISIKFLIKKILNNLFIFFFNLKLKKLLFSIINLFDFIQISRKIKFTKKRINYDDLNNITENLDKIFIKIDIEGSEYRIIEDLLKIQDKIVGLVIEFHDIDLHMDKIEKFINEIKLELIHLHPNNYCKLDKFNDPTIIELSFEKKPIIVKELFTIPHELDQNCNPKGPNININFL